MDGLAPPPVIRPERTAAELRSKLASLDRELTAWRDATRGDDAPLRRHHTQVEAIAGTLGQAASDLAYGLRGAEEGTWILERAVLIERRILDLHRLWGFFRDKLALRFVPWLEEPLLVADDLAWACYAPMQSFIPPEQQREPPLIYFTGGTTPFLMPRGAPYVVEPLPDGGMRAPEFSEAVRSVPVALIGLPWFQASHLPDAPLIAHEVGHAVEHDLGLADRVRALIEGAVPARHRPAWGAWSSEVFADIYGVLGCGSGFARALAALLAGPQRDVATEVRDKSDWGSYPTRTLRVLLTSAVLEKLRVDPIDPPMASAWRDTYRQRPLKDYEADVGAVVTAVLEGPYKALKDGSLAAVFPYSKDDEQQASKMATRLVKGLEPDTGRIRQLLAAARLAYDRDSEQYARHASAIVLASIARLPSRGMRAAGDEAPPQAVRARRDEIAGHALSALIIQAAPSEQEVGDVQTRLE
jgi:hypothetical protein